MYKVLASFFQEFDYIYRQAFSYQLCGTTFNNNKHS